MKNLQKGKRWLWN